MNDNPTIEEELNEFAQEYHSAPQGSEEEWLIFAEYATLCDEEGIDVGGHYENFCRERRYMCKGTAL